MLPSLYQLSIAAKQITPRCSGLKQQSFLYYSSCWSGIQEWLCWVALAEGLSCSCRQDVGTSPESLRGTWGVCFQDGPLTWLLAGGPSSLPCRLPQRWLEHPYNMAANFLRVRGPGESGRKQGGSLSVLDDPSLGSHTITSALLHSLEASHYFQPM